MQQCIFLATSEVITQASNADAQDVEVAVQAANKAYKTSWGPKVSGYERAQMLRDLADLIEVHNDEIAALEALNCG